MVDTWRIRCVLISLTIRDIMWGGRWINIRCITAFRGNVTCVFPLSILPLNSTRSGGILHNASSVHSSKCSHLTRFFLVFPVVKRRDRAVRLELHPLPFTHALLFWTPRYTGLLRLDKGFILRGGDRAGGLRRRADDDHVAEYATVNTKQRYERATRRQPPQVI